MINLQGKPLSFVHGVPIEVQQQSPVEQEYLEEVHGQVTVCMCMYVCMYSGGATSSSIPSTPGPSIDVPAGGFTLSPLGVSFRFPRTRLPLLFPRVDGPSIRQEDGGIRAHTPAQTPTDPTRTPPGRGFTSPFQRFSRPSSGSHDVQSTS